LTYPGNYAIPSLASKKKQKKKRGDESWWLHAFTLEVEQIYKKVNGGLRKSVSERNKESVEEFCYL